MFYIEFLKSNVPLEGTSIRAPLVCAPVNLNREGA